ncbi:hypothetical protein [Rhodococcus ruber]|uniref:hypothetical protein n=1 Tax=Rhodococcus ruber TaxID=1830 RepID=UPI000C7A5367|nr:hypothetical protein [Rhodococcus ruber]AUM20273.1 hypothetical protein CSW53_27290 [Rhodococcus ruber]
MFHNIDVCVVSVDPEVLFTWCEQLGGDMYYDAEEAAEYRDRAYRLCLFGCPCSKHSALELPPHGEGFVAGPAARRRMTAALCSAVVDGVVVWDDAVRRRVCTVVRDALGDTPRLRAEGTSFTARPERILEAMGLQVGVIEVMRKLILGATGWRHSVPLAFFTGRCDTAAAAVYVADSVRASRRPSAAGASFLEAVSVRQIAEFVREGRAAIIAREPDRWAQLLTECAGWSARPLGSLTDGDDGGDDRQVLLRVDGEAGFVDPAEAVTGPQVPMLHERVEFEQDGYLAAAIEYLVDAAARNVDPVVSWLRGDADAAPPGDLVRWFDAARHGRRRKPAHRALRSVPVEHLPTVLEHSRDYLRASQPAYWEMLLRRARRCR